MGWPAPAEYRSAVPSRLQNGSMTPTRRSSLGTGTAFFLASGAAPPRQTPDGGRDNHVLDSVVFMPRRLSPRAPELLREFIKSVHDLDMILVLHRDPSRWWSAEQIAEELSMRADVAARALEALAGRNLLDVRVGETLAYCWAPLHDHDHVFEAVREIAMESLHARELVLL